MLMGKGICPWSLAETVKMAEVLPKVTFFGVGGASKHLYKLPDERNRLDNTSFWV